MTPPAAAYKISAVRFVENSLQDFKVSLDYFVKHHHGHFKDCFSRFEVDPTEKGSCEEELYELFLLRYAETILYGYLNRQKSAISYVESIRSLLPVRVDIRKVMEDRVAFYQGSKVTQEKVIFVERLLSSFLKKRERMKDERDRLAGKILIESDEISRFNENAVSLKKEINACVRSIDKTKLWQGKKRRKMQATLKTAYNSYNRYKELIEEKRVSIAQHRDAKKHLEGLLEKNRQKIQDLLLQYEIVTDGKAFSNAVKKMSVRFHPLIENLASIIKDASKDAKKTA
jgi:hypothetical protein